MMELAAERPVLTFACLLFYGSGLVCACSALLNARSPQGATAWVLSLLTVPFIAVPLFLIFGQTRFEGYNTRRRIMDSQVRQQFESLALLDPSMMSNPEEMSIITATIPADGQPGFTRRNSVRLLRNGQETYQEMLQELERAAKYIVFQFYIFRDDESGRRFAEVLMRKARQGVSVSVLVDEIGETPRRFLKEMAKAGVKVAVFNSRGVKGKLQVNFRNHRKIVIVDGQTGFIGGFNIGDDYLGKYASMGAWRDTHLRIEGPSVMAAQLAAAKDWYFVKQEHMNAEWKITPSGEDANVLVLHTGPADEKHSCLLAHVALISAAGRRLWIANPYFVPPTSLLDAILLAGLRGVDVRVLLPSYSDSPIIMQASKVYQEKLLAHGAKIYRYTGGFLHQKVMLIDDDFAVIGSANLDYRSMFINFEITAVTDDRTFIAEMERMLEQDFLGSDQISLDEFQHASLLTQITSRGADLMAPIL